MVQKYQNLPFEVSYHLGTEALQLFVALLFHNHYHFVVLGIVYTKQNVL
jgi:hypothetical protein